MFSIGRLIVGTSGSPGSLHALRYGEVLARAHDAVLIPVIAWEVPGESRRADPAAERTGAGVPGPRLSAAPGGACRGVG